LEKVKIDKKKMERVVEGKFREIGEEIE